MEVRETKDAVSEAGEEVVSFADTCRFAARMGLAAARFGADTLKLELFMQDIMAAYGYESVFRATQSEILASFQEGDPVHMFPYTSGMELHKLGRLAELAKSVKAREITQSQAIEQLCLIEEEKDPWDNRYVFCSLVAIGASFPAALEGTWWDALLGALSGGIVFLIMKVFDKFDADSQRWMYFVSAFVCSALASLVKVGRTAANVRKYRVPEPYHGKGIRYKGEVISLKVGKSSGKK